MTVRSRPPALSDRSHPSVSQNHRDAQKSTGKAADSRAPSPDSAAAHPQQMADRAADGQLFSGAVSPPAAPAKPATPSAVAKPRAKKPPANERAGQLLGQELTLLEMQLPASYEPLDRLKQSLLEVQSQATAIILDGAPLKSAAQASILSGYLERAQDVRELALCGVKVSVEALAEMAAHPSAYASIETFTLTEHGMTKTHFIELAKIIAAMPSLKSLTLSHCNPGGADMAPIFRAIGNASALRSLVLDGNTLTRESAAAMSNSFKKMADENKLDHLETISLASTDIGGIAGELLAKACGHAPGLQSVSLKNVTLSHDAVQAWAVALTRAAKLAKLTLGNSTAVAEKLRPQLSKDVRIQ